MDINELALERVNSLTRTVTLRLLNIEIETVIRPGGVSPATSTRLRALSTTKVVTEEQQVEATNVILRLMQEIIVSWDLTNGGVPVPTTEEGFTALGYDYLNILFEGLMEALSSGPKETSSSPSPATKPARTSRQK